MSYLPVCRSRTSVRVALGLVLLMAGLPASRGEAQGSATGTAKPGAAQVPDYRLTEAVVRRVSAVMREWDPTPDLESMLGLTHVGTGMTKEQLEALPDSQQVMILLESQKRAKAKYREGEKQVHSLTVGSLSERTRSAGSIPALRTALGKARFSTSEFVQAYSAYHHAMGYVLSEELGSQPAPPPGIRQNNIDLFRAMSKAEQLWTILGLTASKE